MPYPFDVDVPRFTGAEIARAVGWTMAALNNATRGDHPIIRPTKPAGGTGRVNLFSYRRAMQIALTAALMRQGFKVSHAANVALSFTDHGTEERPPLELFGGASTVLLVWPGIESGEVIRMVMPSKDEPGTPMCNVFFAPLHGRQVVATPIWVDFIDRDLRGALGLH